MTRQRRENKLLSIARRLVVDRLDSLMKENSSTYRAIRRLQACPLAFFVMYFFKLFRIFRI